MGLVIFGITAFAWKISAEREFRAKFPEEGRFFPSRWYVQSLSSVTQMSFQADLVVSHRWSKQIIEHERQEKAKQSKA